MEQIRILRLFPFFILSVMFLLMIGSAAGDSTTTDEQAHIPAGYSYVRFLDYRLNPEHPPLVKALAGLFLLPLHLTYPLTDSSWVSDINGQWRQGTEFIYNSGNRPEVMLFFARLPMMLLTILLGALLYIWTRRRFSAGVANMTLLLYAFSPTILAHGRYVTTDIGASLGFFIGIATFLRFLKNPSRTNILIAGVCFGIAELLKFSTFLLLPIYAVMLLAWAFSQQGSAPERARILLSLLWKTALVGLVGLVVIWAGYAVFTWNYPIERQVHDTTTILQSFGTRGFADLDVKLAARPITRPIAHYLLGILMVVQRSAGGNTSSFLGVVSNTGSTLYFPILYLTKEPLPVLILLLIALCLAIKNIWRSSWGFEKIKQWIREDFALFSAIFFILFYWAYSIRSPLNIGVRHVLPTFPFIYLLVSNQINAWFHPVEPTSQGWMQFFRSFYRRYIVPLPRRAFVFVLFLWLIAATLGLYPFFLSSYNELAGGPTNGYEIAVDSNYDWGQDLARLADYAKDHGIDKIMVDYFGGSDASYYLGERYVPWSSARGAPHGYFAISATLREGALNPTKNYTRKPENSYEWLKTYKPVDRVGYSIFIYKLP